MQVICDKCKSQNITIREGKYALIFKCKDCHTEWHIPLKRTKTKKVGFTGTRAGMSDLQRAVTVGLLVSKQAEIAHHGGCIGADIDFDDICSKFQPRSIVTVVHPSNLKNQQGGWHFTIYVKPEKPPLDRNKDIVNEADFLIATPKESTEVLRSGTWATIRYARKAKKPVYIIFPNGAVKAENND